MMPYFCCMHKKRHAHEGNGTGYFKRKSAEKTEIFWNEQTKQKQTGPLKKDLNEKK